MNDLEFITTEGEPNENDYKQLVAGLRAHHASQGHPRESKKFSIFAKNKSGKVLAGIIVTFLWNGMRVDSLWVDEMVRSKKYGTKLMQLVEEEAMRRGCTIAYADTFSWQAPEFYEKLGYTSYGTLENFPHGHALHYYYKKLTQNDY